ncbi:MAG TPA: ricin-type beta-trefoil lectin domain protein [Gemmatimonadaceae bacterium]|jgi:parallel beta-helix repeat protein|nr:ricin-type beta-trefoil lectin domain protein [Gemmatimonadaceae bacterium]
MRYINRALATLLVLTAGACSDTSAPASRITTAPLQTASFALVGGGGVAAQIKSRPYSDMCIDVPASAYVDGKALETWSCHPGANQQFIWKASGEIVPVNSQSMCIDDYGGQGKDGDPIIIWTCHGGINEKWTATAAGEIKGINGKCIGLATSARANGTRLSLQPCSGSANQAWDNATGSTTPPPSTPPPSGGPPPVPAGIAILPGQSIQAAVNANPAGATFILKAGTHTRQSVIPKSGNRFIGEPGAILDGQGVGYAFAKGNPPYPSNVTIRGLKITGYNPGMQSGTIDAGGYAISEATTGWIIDWNEISYNGEYGVHIGSSLRLANNYIHHNKRLNIAGSGNGTTIVSNEIAFGNYLNAFNTNFEAGGTKFSYSDGLVIQNNNVHDNVGVGIHMDENNINTIIEGNRIEKNGSEGVAIEISYKTTIRNNTVLNNGWADPRNRYTYLWNAGIGVHASPNVEVYGNTVSGNYAGIVAIEQDRSADRASYGAHIVQNFYVHDNVITQTNLPRNVNELSVASGIVTDIAGNSAIFTSRNNRYVNNTYYLLHNPRPFAWNNGTRTESDWKSYGLDVSGIFNH